MGQIFSTRDILLNGNYILQGITSSSGLISLFYTNLTINNIISSSGLICDNNSTLSGNVSISGSVYIRTDRDIYNNGSGVWASILSLSGWLNACIASLRGYNLTISGTLTTSGIICYGDSSKSESVYIDKFRDIYYNGLGIFLV